MKKLIFALSIVSIAFTSCDKKITDPTTNTTNANTSATSPMPASGDGAIVAVKTVTKTTVAGFPVTTELGTGVAVFGDLANATYNDAGAISLNTKSLAKQSTNSYVYTPSATDITGIDFSSSISWSVAGGGSLGAFTHDATAQGFPAISDINGSATSINSANSFTLSAAGSISNADSVYFQLSGPTTTIVKHLAGNSSSATFTAAEVQSVGKGSGVIIIAPWNWSVKSLGGKQINVINEVALSRVVTIE
jgi:hypothetical protein